MPSKLALGHQNLSYGQNVEPESQFNCAPSEDSVQLADQHEALYLHRVPTEDGCPVFT